VDPPQIPWGMTLEPVQEQLCGLIVERIEICLNGMNSVLRSGHFCHVFMSIDWTLAMCYYCKPGHSSMSVYIRKCLMVLML
jgi:hypothetical protein